MHALHEWLGLVEMWLEHRAIDVLRQMKRAMLARTLLENIMSYEIVYEKMAEIVRANEGQLLTAFSEDFHSFDREFLKSYWTETTRFLWMLREHGTFICRLGVHPEHVEGILTAIELSFGSKLFVVEGSSIKEVSVIQARALLCSFDFLCTAGMVRRRGQTVARFSVAVHHAQQSSSRGEVYFESASRDQNWSLDDLIAMLIIAQCETVCAAQSLFVTPRVVTLDGEKLSDLIDAAQQQKQAQKRVA